MWIIYNKKNKEKVSVRNLIYSGEFMGACSVSVSVTSPTPIEFELGDYLVYRGERFEINYDPTVVKQSSYETFGEGFVYDNIVFNSLSDELTRCDFLDYVKNDNNIHYTSLPTFSFFADSIEKLADRIQANLDRVYTGEKAWTVKVHPEYVNTLNVNIQASNNTVWDALGFVNSKFGANFIIRNRTITIGTTGLAVGQLFSYGKGNGLYKIEKNAESNQKVITRLRAYGSTKNMPADYYLNVEGGNVPNNMAVKNLMLPSFPIGTRDPFIDSKNKEELGIREGTVFFDGSGDLEEIYPTMEGMTAEDLRLAGIIVNATGNLDEVVSAEQISDSGKFEEGTDNIPNFTITLKDIGFDINEYKSTSAATISMKDGMCGGREFEIVQCKKSSNNYILTCKRHYDSGLDLYYPYKDYQIKAGDKYVLLNIEMPDVYIKAASQRLLEAATAYLAKNDYVRYSYSLSVDNIFMARQHDEAVANGSKSIHDTIKEGDLMLFEDNDLGIENKGITISSLSIKENADESIIPEYGITLQDEKTVGTLDKIQNQISSILGNSSSSSVNTEQVQSIIQAYGSRYFLRKDKDDRSKGKIASDKGFEVGKYVEGTLGGGASIYMRDGSSYSEVDYLKVRKKATFTDITVQELKHVGGEIILSPAAMVCTKVEELTDGYKCFFNKKDSDGRRVYNEFRVGDQARCQTFNLAQNPNDKVGNHYYWRYVSAIGDDFIVLSKTDCDTNSDTPQVGDNISQLGNRRDKQRQAAIILSAFGDDAPSYKQYNGIDSFSLEGKQVTKLSPYGNELTGKLNIEQGSTGASNLKDLPDFIDEAVQVGSVNLLLNSGFTGNYESESMEGVMLSDDSELFSKTLKCWDGIASVKDDPEAVSGKSVEVGSISQAVETIKNEYYVISFKAKGSEIAVSCGGYHGVESLTGEYERYEFKFQSDGSCGFLLSGTAKVCDLQLERGTIATDWNASPYDNDKTLAEFQALKYIQDAIVNGSTDIIGGLILTSMLKLGNYKDGVLQKVNAGVSGIYNDADDVAFWAGGALENALRTAIEFKQNPNFKPTMEQWKNLANFVVTHGGDLFLRGNIYAENGYFRGDLEQGEGKTLLSKDGSGHLADRMIHWNKYGVMYRKAHEIIEWVNITDFKETHAVDLKEGYYLDLSLSDLDDAYTLPNGEYDGQLLTLRFRYNNNQNRREGCAVLNGTFSMRKYYDDIEQMENADRLILDAENVEFQLVYSSTTGWTYYGEGASISGVLLTIGKVKDVELETVTAKIFKVEDKEGISKTITIQETGGTARLVFTGGILTSYSFESKEE